MHAVGDLTELHHRVRCYLHAVLVRTPFLAWAAIVVAFAACASDAPVGNGDGRDAASPCGPEGHLSPRGNCLFPVADPNCPSALHYASGKCVIAFSGDECGCSSDGNDCHEPKCADGECVQTKKYDMSSCQLGGARELEGGIAIPGPWGTCHSGECCTGCWDGAVCRPGESRDACGSRGESCQMCVPVPGDTCGSSDCSEQYCLRGLVNGPGCPHCGSAGEPCCASPECEAGLRCEAVGLAGEDGPSILVCVAPKSAADGG